MTSYEERLRDALAQQHRQVFDPERKVLRDEIAQHIPCPVCDSWDATLEFTKDWFTFSRCTECSMVYLNPRLTEQATYDFYNSPWNAIYNETKFATVSDSTSLDDAINRANLERIQRAGGRGELLEIGFASGVFLRAAKRAGFSVHGIELNADNYRAVRAELGPTMHDVDLFRASLPAAFFDVVYMRDVFEHVPEPKAMLREIHRIARPGALLYIEVPNIEGLIYKVVRERHVCIFGFEHLNYWSPETLRKILELTGFTVRETTFASLDFTVRDVLGTYLAPTHTTLYPPPLGALRSVALRALEVAWNNRLARRITHPVDRALTPRIADWMGRGSVVKVLAEKRRDT